MLGDSLESLEATLLLLAFAFFCKIENISDNFDFFLKNSNQILLKFCNFNTHEDFIVISFM